MSRDSYKFYRTPGFEYERSKRVGWIDQFANKLATEPARSAVDVARERDRQSITDQINSALCNRSTHATVESRVKELQDRIGLTDYLKRMSTQNKSTKIAQEASQTNPKETQEASNKLPTVLEKLNEGDRKKVIDYVQYLLKSSYGHLPLPAIQYELGSLFGDTLDGKDINDPDFTVFLNKMVVDWQKEHPGTHTDDHIGASTPRDDPSKDDNDANADFFRGCMPNKQ